MIIQVFSIIAPVFFGAAFGYIWAKQGRPFDTDFVTSLILNVGTPLLVFSNLTSLEVKLKFFGVMAVIAVLALAVFAAISALILWFIKAPQRTFLASMMLPNMGNMGLPLCLLAFGEEGLTLGIMMYTIISVSQFTIGLGIAAGSIKLGELARTPLLYAVGISLIFIITETHPPPWLANTTKLFGQMVIPLMLIMLGCSLAKLKMHSLPRSLALSVLRFVMGLVTGMTLAQFFGLEGIAKGVVILQCAMPIAVFNYIFAERYNNNPEEVAGLVITSTIFSFLTLPFLLWFVL